MVEDDAGGTTEHQQPDGTTLDFGSYSGIGTLPSACFGLWMAISTYSPNPFYRSSACHADLVTAVKNSIRNLNGAINSDLNVQGVNFCGRYRAKLSVNGLAVFDYCTSDY